MHVLETPIRGYAWGSRTAIAALQGRAPAEAPEAELWIGAHHGSPSTICGVPLDEIIASSPGKVLGEPVVHRYGPRLPFLLKVLAAAEPLSLQAHPDLGQAQAGFAAEEAAGVPRDSPERTYVDAWHKPEMLVAVEEFEVLCGFAEPSRSAALLAGLGVDGLKPLVETLNQPDPEAALREAVVGLLSLPEPARAVLVADVVSAAQVASDPAYALIGDLATRYPGDVGVVVALLLNRVTLQPDEAVWMPAGNLHSYLRGLGVEIMAASDNVLRGGLTPKYVNVPELLRVLRFEVLADPVLRPQEVGDGLRTWPVPAADFTLHRADLSADARPVVQFPGAGPRVVLCLRGSVTADDGVQSVTLTGGQAAFVYAGTAPVTVSGAGQVYQASTNG
jgi:mannose-6-phosphate isomerase